VNVVTSATDEALRSNPLLSGEGLPRFDAIRPEHVVPAVRRMLAEAEEQFARLEQGIEPTWSGVMESLEAIDRLFERAWQPVSHLMGVCNSDALRAAHEVVLPEVVAFGLKLRQSQTIYRALCALRDEGAWSSLSAAQRRVVEEKLRDAKLAGIGLEGVSQERFNAIVQELSQLGTDFSNHVLDATMAFAMVLTQREEVEGLPASALQQGAQSYNAARASGEAEGSRDVPQRSGDTSRGQEATPEGGPWRITLDEPSVLPFLQHSRRRDLRERLYRAYVTRASSGACDNTPLIARTLALRREQARLLGFGSFVEMSLASKAAPSVEAVRRLLEELREASWSAAVSDLDDLRRLAAASGQTEPLVQWDAAFWVERLREQRFGYSDEDLRPYFPMPRVLEGLFQLVRQLFGVVVTPADGEAPVWHPDVRYFRVSGEDGSPIASFYLDPYARPGSKRGGAWMDDCLGRRRMGSEWQRPVAHLVCNGTPPVGGRPSLMTFREVETLFHEFGHGLQHMLTMVDVADAAGIRGVEWDTVEFPSQFLQQWCYHRPMLLGMTAHVETGEPLPERLLEQLLAARTFRAGSQMLRQLFFAMTDLALHHEYDPDGTQTPFSTERQIAERTTVLPPLPEDRFLCAFSHIFAGGYAAGYYSYKWAEVMSADAFGAFEEAGLDNAAAVATLGRRFRETVLALGGSRHPMEVFTAFRGREPSPAALLRQMGLGVARG